MVILSLGLFSMLLLVPIADQAFAGVEIRPVGGLLEPVPESELYGELAKQYSLWLIPSITAVGIGVYIIKRKF